MAKFYARLVVLGSLCVFFLVALITMGPALLKYDVSRNVVVSMRRDIASVEDPNTNSHVTGRIRSSILLVTDDKSTIQTWGWPVTRRTLQECALVDYSQEELPSMSVIICFHGKENVSNLLHTVHGVYQRTPAHLLKEIILIDDNSCNDDFGKTLELYVEVIFNQKVVIYRSPEKIGLIKARLHGIRMARAEVVVVMDSHVEVQPGWAEPLLHEIQKNPKTMAASYLDWMEKKGNVWEYRHGGTNWKSYFDWTFIFGWQALGIADIMARKSLIEPIKTPVVIGTIYAIRRDFFEEVGAFDSGMLLWGGENLDLPVRVWLCGGRVINVPCSRAGHLESPGHRDYRLNPAFRDAKNANYKRFAEVWTDDFKKYFYMYTPEAKEANAGDLSSRMSLKSVCRKDFNWFLKEIFPELGVPDRDSYAWGMVENLGNKMCLDTRASMIPGLEACGTGFSRQGIFWNKELHLRLPIHIMNNKDLTMFGMKERGLYLDEFISHYNTSSGTQWLHWENGPIIDIKMVLCLEAEEQTIVTRTCDLQSPHQQWRFEHYTKDYYELMSGKVDNSDPSYKRVQQLLEQYKQLIPAKKRPTRRTGLGVGDEILIPHLLRSGRTPKS